MGTISEKEEIKTWEEAIALLNGRLQINLSWQQRDTQWHL